MTTRRPELADGTWGGSIKTRPHNELAASRVVLVDGSGEEARQRVDLESRPPLPSLPQPASETREGTIRVLVWHRPSAFPAITIRDYGGGAGQQCSSTAEGAELNKLKVRSTLSALSRCALRMYLTSLRGRFLRRVRD
jgi:hypothetical protein